MKAEEGQKRPTAVVICFYATRSRENTYAESPEEVVEYTQGWEWVALLPGTGRTWRYGGPHEEGYSYTEESVTLSEDGATLHMNVHTSARDCDGQLDTNSLLVASVADIGDDGKPDWERVSSGQRDYAAEAMGY